MVFERPPVRSRYFSVPSARKLWRTTDRLFVTYQQLMAKHAELSAADQLKEFRHYADACLSLVDAPPESREGQFHRRLAALDVSTANPLLLEILYQDRSDLRDALKVIESFLVRRAVCGLTPKGYNRFFVQVLDAADGAGD